MTTKAEQYAKMAERMAVQLTGSWKAWTDFLTTASRLYKYPFHEQLMIYAQRPDATACAEYDLWNKQMGRYVRRGSTGIALLDESGDRVKLRYVFDIADTGERANSRRPFLWEMQEDHIAPVQAMLEERFGVPGREGVAQQLADVAIRLAEEYWQDNQHDIRRIVDDSFLEEYDDLNLELQFKSAATVSITYSLMARCGLEPEQYFDHEDFMAIFDFNTPQSIATLGTAVSQINQQVLRQIGLVIRNAEREKIRNQNMTQFAERSEPHEEQPDLSPERRLPDPQPDPDRSSQQPPEQVRQDAENLPEGTPSDPVQPAASVRTAVSPSSGDPGHSQQPSGIADAPVDAGGRGNGGAESPGAHDLGGADEQLQSPGRGNDPEGAYQQLSLDLFLSEAAQIAQIEEAERVEPTPFAFSLSQEQIDTVLRLGGNTDQHRMAIVAEYLKEKPISVIARRLPEIYRGGNGFRMDGQEVSAWYDQEGIHLARGRTARYAKTAQLLSWEDAARRINQLMEDGSFATNVELAEAAGYERQQLAQSLWYLHNDFSQQAVEQNYLPALAQITGTSFPDGTQQLAKQLDDPTFVGSLLRSFQTFREGYQQEPALLRFHYHRLDRIENTLKGLLLPQRELESNLAEIPKAEPFITEDELDMAISIGSGFAGGKQRIYGYFQQEAGPSKRAEWLKKEYGTGGRSHALSSASHSEESHDAKGVRYQKAGCETVTFSWLNMAKRIESLIKQDRYLTEPEKKQLDAIQEAQEEPEAESDTPAPVQHREITQSDMDEALQRWNGNMDSKRAVVRYMADHARERDTAAWLATEYGTDSSKPLHITVTGTDIDYEMSWPKVQRRIAQLIREDRFFTEQEKDAFEDIDPVTIRGNLAQRGIVNGEVVDPDKLNADPFIQQVVADVEQIAVENDRFHVVEVDRGFQTAYAIWDDTTDNYYADEDGVTEEFTSEWQANDYLRVLRNPATVKEQPVVTAEQTEPFKVGDTVYLDDTAFEITEVGRFDVQLRDPTLLYPIFRAESKERLTHLLSLDERNADILSRIENKPSYTTETVAVYPAEENHLPFDVVIQTLRTEEPEPPTQDGSRVSIPIDGEWTEFPNQAEAEKAAYEEHKRQTKVNAQNFHISDDELGTGGAKAKFEANINAIRLLKSLEAEGMQATPEQQEVLSRYVGWGGLPDAFDSEKPGWEKEYQQLKALLTPEEYEAARASTLNAHYTSPTVIRAIYEAVKNMGFQTGNILEPSMGVGNFFGMLPESMENSRLYGVELDSITGRIAKQLYPKANITVAGFETTDRRDFFDLAIGNVPFGQYKVNDPAYNKLGFNIHNYFLAKALDQVRPGGVVAFVTSRYTMDAKNPEVRKYLAQRADLLGAIRLPNDAFKANAGTEVVSDIIFLQKRDRPCVEEPEWVGTGLNAQGYAINRYFLKHPEMVLGNSTEERTAHGMDYTVEPIDALNLSDQLHDAVKYIRGTYQEAALPELGEGEAVDTSIPADPNVKNYSYAVVDGEVYFRENSRMVKPELNATATERIKGMVQLRDCVRHLIDLQMWESDPAEIHQEQQRLNKLYDGFSAKYGLINDRANRLAFVDDSSYYLLCSLEVLDEDGKLERKADMFTKRTIQQHRAVTSVGTASEALAVSIAEKARVDMAYMSQLTGKSTEEIAADLKGVIFKDPAFGDDPLTGWQTADEYLSGNVRQKLRAAQRAADKDSAFSGNVEALKAAQPKDLDASEIEVRLGATWIHPDYIRQFMYETFDTPQYLRSAIDVKYAPFTAEWQITGKTAVSYNNIAAYTTYGTDRANAYRILEDSLNLRDVRIYDTEIDPDGKERRVLNAKETTLAAQKQQAIREAFKDWIWRDPERRQALVRQYNEEMNSIRPREYDGSHIVFSGMNPEITLREHQRNAIAHVLYGGNTLLAHEVGAGKTFEMVAAAMESKRLGLCSKSIFVVPNHLTEQWASEFLRLYPAANILVTTKKDFEAHNRKKFCARIATGDYDAVIIGHSQFERIPISMERQVRLIREQIQEVTEGIREVKDSHGERFTIKQLERTKRNLETRLEKLRAGHRKDDVITFEQLGVDRMFVDEAHNYKNMFLYTKMRNVAGLSTTDAQKSSDMFAKCRYLDEVTGNRGVVFATGTPVSNSMTELYTMQRYLQYDRLEQMGMTHFDCWASRFGETVTALELAPEGTGYRARTRFSKFFNLPELMNLFKEVADIKTADQLNLPTPEVEYHTVVAKPTEHQQDMVAALSERAAVVHAGDVDPSVDNMLKITSDGRKLGLDQRIINPMLPDQEGTKVNQCVSNIMQIWRDGESDKLTQLVFCDISTPKASPGRKVAKGISGNLDSPELHALETAIPLPEVEPAFTVYEDIRQKLIAQGVPPGQIAFIHEANTEVRKKELFAKVRSGQVRVLLGSTSKMGAGTNVQDRLVALHDLDCPWRPGDLQQRKGRIERQGNQNEKVHVFRYVTEGTFDAYLWQTVENKQKFISQIMTSKSPVRSCDDVDETALSFAEIKALCAGDPRIKERMDLDVEVARLKLMKADHQSKQFRLEDNLLTYFPEQIEKYKGFIRGFEADMQTLAAHPHPENGFAGMEVRGDLLTDKENAGAALLDACKEVWGKEPVPIGSYRGFEMQASFDNIHQEYELTLRGQMIYTAYLSVDPRGNLVRIDNALGQMQTRLDAVQTQLDNLYQQQAAAKNEVGKVFPYEEELRSKSARLVQLDMELNMDGRKRPPQQQIAKSSRPSVLENLRKTPPQRTGEKKEKHREEVR